MPDWFIHHLETDAKVPDIKSWQSSLGGTVGSGISFIRARSFSHIRPSVKQPQLKPIMSQSNAATRMSHPDRGPSLQKAITQEKDTDNTDKWTLPGYCWRPGGVCSVPAPRYWRESMGSRNECGKRLFPGVHISELLLFTICVAFKYGLFFLMLLTIRDINNAWINMNQHIIKELNVE